MHKPMYKLGDFLVEREWRTKRTLLRVALGIVGFDGWHLFIVRAYGHESRNLTAHDDGYII